MRNSTRRGVDPYPREYERSEFDHSEPVFPLNRQHPYRNRRAPGRDATSAPDLRPPISTRPSLDSRESFDPRASMFPPSVSRTWPFEGELNPESGVYEIFEAESEDEPKLPLNRTREIVVRFLGGLVVGATLYTCGLVLANPQAGREVLSWVTLGHGDQAAHVIERAAGAARQLAAGR